MNRYFLSLSLLAALPLAAHAQWQPTAELGVVNTTGNSETTSVNGKFALSGEDEAWTHDYYAAALRAESSDELTANRVELGAKSARKLGERSYLGGVGRYENDDFSAYRYQATLAVNYGFEAFKTDRRRLLLEAGPGIRSARLADSGESERDALLRGFADYKHQITDSTNFFNTLLVEAAQDNTFLQNDIGISVSINRTLALKAALQARHNTDAPGNRDRTDTLASVNIVWSPHEKRD
ncbi:MAG: DUF481 domain-containing protein [Arenimonas sp.]|uniref:DUF481 domain-containing protein n=1 Tax=Arenimonas sp. TaxID=1872635 RepID=UPI0025C4FCE0|nr:DUF481 domain-containing protein [Arenimonas sp.]MBW8368832.1 DUF481 domain-containing protein [Arenimonas sp.]